MNLDNDNKLINERSDSLSKITESVVPSKHNQIESLVRTRKDYKDPP
jgi:hypothetical protein